MHLETTGNKLTAAALFFAVFSMALYVLDTLTFAGFAADLLRFNPAVIAAVTVALFLVMRVRGEYPDAWTTIFTIAAPAALYLSAGLYALDQIFHANFVFATFHIHPDISVNIGLLLTVFTVTSITSSFVRQRLGLLLGIIPFWLFALVTVAWIYLPSVYQYFKLEDSVVEYLTMFAFAATAVYSAKSLLLLRSKRLGYLKYLHMIVYIVIFVGSVFIAGEEISWGQRIIGFDTPDRVASFNDQGELTLHNQDSFMRYVPHMYLIVSAYGIFGWLTATLVERNFPHTRIAKILTFWTPPRELTAFFIPIMAFAWSRLYPGIPQDILKLSDFIEETLELILGLGIMLFIYFNFQKLQQHKKTLKLLLG